MALKWVSKVRSLLPGGSSETVESEVVEPSKEGSVHRAQPKPAPPPPPPNEDGHPLPWHALLVDQIPFMMLVIGGLLTACAELIGPWGFLGFLLVVSSPVVYWLRRIERRLAELVTLSQKKESHRR